jgi:hypothetical protein
MLFAMVLLTKCIACNSKCWNTSNCHTKFHGCIESLIA